MFGPQRLSAPKDTTGKAAEQNYGGDRGTIVSGDAARNSLTRNSGEDEFPQN